MKMGVQSYSSWHVPQQRQEGGHGPHSNMLGSITIWGQGRYRANLTSRHDVRRRACSSCYPAIQMEAYHEMMTASPPLCNGL
jgi:hypothetical protein